MKPNPDKYQAINYDETEDKLNVKLAILTFKPPDTLCLLVSDRVRYPAVFIVVTQRYLTPQTSAENRTTALSRG